VVLDLVVQAAQGGVDDPAAAYVPGGQHLLAQVVLGAGRVRHALVVRREGEPEVVERATLVDHVRKRL